MQIVFYAKETDMPRAVKNGIRAVLVLGICGLLGCSGEMGDENISTGVQGSQKDPESYIFLRHRFMEENATIPDGTENKLAWSKQHYTAARNYMLQKVADFKHKVCDLEPDGNFLETICNEVFVNANGQPYNGYGSNEMDENIGQNKLGYSNLLGAVAAKVTGGIPGDSKDYDIFETCYTKLANRSYNDSLGYRKDSTNLAFNQEKASIDADLTRLGVPTDYNNVEAQLDNLLQTASLRSGVSVGALRDVVNLSLMNAGLWGARDLAASAGFQLSDRNTLRVPSSELDNLNRKNLVHNLGTYWMKYNRLEYQNNQQQEQGNTL